VTEPDVKLVQLLDDASVVVDTFVMPNRNRITLLGRRRRKARGLRGSLNCGKGWKANKRRTKCIRRR
jgi:hypothetical protein